MKMKKKYTIVVFSLLFIAFLLYVVEIFFSELLPNNIKYIHSIVHYIGLSMCITAVFYHLK